MEGVIRADECYTLPAFQERVGIQKHVLAGLKKSGLPVRYIGVRGYIAGSDWIDFLKSVPPGQRLPAGEINSSAPFDET